MIEVKRSVWNGIEGPRKTKAGKRVVYLDSITIQILREHLGIRRAGRVFQITVRHSTCEPGHLQAGADSALQQTWYRSWRNARIQTRQNLLHTGEHDTERLCYVPGWAFQSENYFALHPL